MNHNVMFSSATDLWSTPQDFFDKLNDEFHFDLDACAIPENAKCEKFYTPEQDGRKQPWKVTVWCNPPYGRKIGQWVKRRRNRIAPLLCYFLPEPTHDGSTNTYTVKPKSDLFVGD